MVFPRDLAGLLVFALFMTGCATTEAGGRAVSAAAPGASPAATPAASATAAGRTPSPEPSPAPSARVRALLAEMTLEEKVGQLFMPFVYGPYADRPHPENRVRYGVAAPAEVIRKYRPGGVVLFPWADNVRGVTQVVELVNGLQQASPRVPLLIAADQENGTVSRLSPLVTELPGAKAIGDTGDTELARAAARLTGTELRALGVNLDFAPVADVNVNPKNPVIGPRAYGSDPKRVARMVRAAVQGFHDAGVAATAKHFPGHGDTTVDSHTGLPVIRHSRAQWERLDAPPFRAAIDQGVDVIMTAHVVMPGLDRSGDPATLSKAVLTGLLRAELGFQGVISTDSLQMQGVREKYGDGEVAVRAVLAGADLLLMPPDFGAAYQAVLAAVRSGRIPLERLDASVTRLLALKERRGVLDAAPADAAAAARTVKSAAHRRIAERIAARVRGSS